MLVIGPDLVRMDLIEKGSELVDDKNNQLHKIGINMSINNPGGFIKFTKNGIWGNPINASYENGKKMLSTIIEKILLLISEEYYK